MQAPLEAIFLNDTQGMRALTAIGTVLNPKGAGPLLGFALLVVVRLEIRRHGVSDWNRA